jgi:hypothetical protein
MAKKSLLDGVLGSSSEDTGLGLHVQASEPPVGSGNSAGSNGLAGATQNALTGLGTGGSGAGTTGGTNLTAGPTNFTSGPAGPGPSTTVTYEAVGSDSNGAVDGKAVITVSGDTMTISLTNLEANASSIGQAISGIELVYGSGAPTPTSFSQNGQLITITNPTYHDDSGSPTHWGDAVSGNDLFIATAGTGAQPHSPINLIVDTKSGFSNADTSFASHDPSIADTGTFTLNFGSTATLPTAVYIEFGTKPDATIAANVVCFLEGVRIATPDGAPTVESLKAGDLVLTHDGREVPVLWIGRRTIARAFADPLRHLPVRVRAGALGDNLPERDLLVSSCHALLVDGILVQAGALVNGTSIVRETDVAETFTYYHIETEDHSLVLAEGVAAETFVDNADRIGFDNWSEHLALYPQGREIDELPLARATSARQVPARLRIRLADQAVAIGASLDQAA